MSNVIRRILGVITLSVFSLFIGCEDNHQIEEIVFELNTKLPQDENGYYRLTIDRNRWQTLHRIEGRVLRNNDGVNVIKFGWSSDLMWFVGDTLGYAIQNTSDELLYIGYDTTYVTWFNGFEVPIVNGASYSDYDGYVNTMLAPVKTMIGDTATIYFTYYDNWRYEDTYGSFNIIFD
tara:strand:- start:265 stop:795 length:531 start_codon:yes stop_codon:yes gene_type:complete